MNLASPLQLEHLSTSPRGPAPACLCSPHSCSLFSISNMTGLHLLFPLPEIPFPCCWSVSVSLVGHSLPLIISFLRAGRTLVLFFIICPELRTGPAHSRHILIDRTIWKNASLGRKDRTGLSEEMTFEEKTGWTEVTHVKYLSWGFW